MKIKGPVFIPQPTGIVLVGGLFFLHDSKGFPYGLSVHECRRRGAVASDSMFYGDARKAGWTHELAIRTLKAERSDSGLPRFPEVAIEFLAACEWETQTTAAKARKWGYFRNGKIVQPRDSKRKYNR